MTLEMLWSLEVRRSIRDGAYLAVPILQSYPLLTELVCPLVNKYTTG